VDARIQPDTRVDQTWAPTPVPSWQGLLTPVLVNLFSELEVGVAMWIQKDHWHPFHSHSSAVEWEYNLGAAPARWEYNRRCFAQVLETKRTHCGSHSGLCDLFVPVLEGDNVPGILVAGPFAENRPTATDVLQRWHELTGKEGSIGDSEFSGYLSARLGTLVLDAKARASFEGLLACLADLLVGRGDAESSTAKFEALRLELLGARDAERMWSNARDILNERKRFWDHNEGGLAFGLTGRPEHVIVGLLAGREGGAWVDDLLQRDAFQRACAVLCREGGEMIPSPIGDHGVAILVHETSGPASARTKLDELAHQFVVTAQRLGLRLHAGVSEPKSKSTLTQRYHAALWTAEKALSQGVSVLHAEPLSRRNVGRLRELRTALGKSLGEGPTLLAPRFERYVEVVLADTGYRLEAARWQLEAGFERITEPVLAAGFLDRKSFDELCASLEHDAAEARTLLALVTVYRRLLARVEAAIGSPVDARQARGTERALTFIGEHLSEPLTLARVARVAGFAPDYFSVVFKREQGTTFARYVQRARIERARHILTSTKLSVDHVHELCGFRNRTYFYRAFKQVTGTTPTEYRNRAPQTALAEFNRLAALKQRRAKASRRTPSASA
jgi:AraC-like DNA-binding protein